MNMSKYSSLNLISLFAQHPVAANLLMLVMLLLGAWSLTQLNTQFLPTFKVNFISIQTIWVGASPEDTERSITIPLEKELRSVDYVKKMTSSSRFGSSEILLEFPQKTNMNLVMEQVKERVNSVRNLPIEAEEPLITKEENFEVIARIVLTGVKNLQELRPLVYRMERDLLDRGIAKIKIVGLPEQMISVQVPLIKLIEVQKSLRDVAERIAQRSQDIPAGTIGRDTTGQQLRSLKQARSVIDFEKLPLVSDDQGQLLRLGDLAKVKLMPRDNEVLATYNGSQAIELILYRSETADALNSAKIMNQWLKEIRQELPQNIKLTVYDESWKFIDQRIKLLLKNGGGGFLLIIILLFIFLNRRIAFWVAMGIPVSFAAALCFLYLVGGSINMVSLFAMIMALGIIVDDTIVVGEEALTQLHTGKPIIDGVETAAMKMLAPVMASSLTTISAFLPLLLVGDVIGTILKTIPIVVICIIIASVIECFLVLPGHLYHSFKHLEKIHKHPMRAKIDQSFNYFRDHIFRNFVTKAINNRGVTLSIAVSCLVLTVALLQSGRINFTFFPSPDGSTLQANVQFIAGTPPDQVKEFLHDVERALTKTEQELQQDSDPLVLTSVTFENKGAFDRGTGPQLGSLIVELTEPDSRTVSNKQFIEAWRKNIKTVPGLESLIITTPRAGPRGKDLDIAITGPNAETIKQAAEDLAQELRSYSGVSDIEDDLPYGQVQALFELTPQGESLDLTVESVGRQLRSAFIGHLAQIYHEGNDEIEVRVMLPDHERFSLITLEQLPIITPGGGTAPLNSIVSINRKRGFDVLRHTDTKLTAHVTAEVDPDVTNANKIIGQLSAEVMPELEQKYGIKYKFEGRAEEQRDTLRDMLYGLILALALIYIILAWVFSSYGWPFIVMVAIPLGLVGALIGHWLLDKDLTILSLFGLFGLSGIVINDSIILITAYKRIRDAGSKSHQAIIDASCERLRAVLLTSLTTIAGLTPLLFETSVQAQFLIPMAISITFGLAFATLLILIVIPALLSIYEDLFGDGNGIAVGDFV